MGPQKVNKRRFRLMFYDQSVQEISFTSWTHTSMEGVYESVCRMLFHHGKICRVHSMHCSTAAQCIKKKLNVTASEFDRVVSSSPLGGMCP